MNKHYIQVLSLIFLTLFIQVAFAGANSYPDKEIATIPAEFNPGVIAIAPDGSYLYVIADPYPNAPWYANRKVLVIDTQSRSVISTITIGTAHNDIVVSSDGNWAYALNANSHNVMKIDLGTNSVVASTGLNGYLSHFTLSSDDKYLYVSEWFPGTLAEIETSTMNIKRRIGIGGTGHYGSVITHDGKQVYTILFHQDKVAIVNVPTWTVSWLTIPAPNGIEMAPDGSYLCIGQNHQPSTVSLVNTSINNIMSTIQVGPGISEQMTMSSDSRYLYMPFPNDNSVGVIDLPSHNLIAIVPVGNKPWGAVVSPDGNYVYVTNRNDGTISIIGHSNHPPVANAGSDITLEATSVDGATLTLDGSASYDPDGDELTFHWTAQGISFDNPNSPTPTAIFPLGATEVILVVSDGDLDSEPDAVIVKVVDTTPPELTISFSPDKLWPPNHKMIDIQADIIVTDIGDPAPSVSLVSIISNEPDNGLGDGDKPNDIQGADFGMLDTEFQLRAERSGTGSGRVYAITYCATDASGNSVSLSDSVFVPHNLGKSLPSDEEIKIPEKFVLYQNYPNPFNPETEITYQIPKSYFVNLTIYNQMGQIIRTLANENQEPGQYRVRWDGTDNFVRKVSSGIYMYVLKAGEFQETKKALLLQ